MVNKHAPRPLLLEPLYPLFFVSPEGSTEIPAKSIIPEQVGEKAFGLSCLPKAWTLPFIVVSDELFTFYKSSNETNRELITNCWADQIIRTMLTIGIEEQDQIIVRSSGCSEGFKERGKFHSVKGTLKNVDQPLAQCLEQLASDADLKDQKIPLVIQKYVVPISAKGHLSNERRISKEKRDWLGQFEEQKNVIVKPYFKIPLREWRERINVGNKFDLPLGCNLTAHVSEVLKIPAAWGAKQRTRLHFEWVWNGDVIYLVQADQVHDIKGIDPTKIHQSKSSIPLEFQPKCLKEINEALASRYNKIRNVFTYIKLGLPRTKLYVLDDQSIIDGLAEGYVSADLEEDLSELVKGSLVIRMDIATDDTKRRQLLPRTHEVREIGKALEWLKQQSADIKIHELQNDDVVFLFHNFVPAVSSAFAFAAPGERKVQIEALWGLPEGLYYNAHDKYIVDTQTPRVRDLRHEDFSRFVIYPKLYFKQFIVAPDTDGRWITQILKHPFDWGGTIHNQEWIKEIALESRRIAEEVGNPLSIMWFVGVSSKVCSRPVLPWYHEPYDPKINNRARIHRKKTPFDKPLVIKTSADIETLRLEAENPPFNIRLVRIQPSEEALLRDKGTLRTIGELVRKIDAVILLEGGVLSHAYYQLLETKATVEVMHPFDDFEDKQEFNKLVRDKVPANIERGGEIVSKTSLSGEYFLRALREKLIEEAFEVMDATDQDSILGELADLSEIIDEILSQLNLSQEELRQRQEEKRTKAGGFKEGLVLLETRNPLPTNKSEDTSDSLFAELGHISKRDSVPIDDREIIELSHNIEKWSDRREHQAVTEVILNLVIPMVRDNWTDRTQETVIDEDSGVAVQANISGKRQGAKVQIELSVFTKQKQLKLFK